MSESGVPLPGHDTPAILELARADIGFSAAHFSVLGGIAERLHGHNYRASLRAHGVIGADGAVVDFHVLKQALRSECASLDERMLVATAGTVLSVHWDDDAVEVRDGNRRFVFPRADVVLLPVSNTTCECLAAHLLSALRERLGSLPVRLEITVEEVPGQGATVSE
jgi:6-pyruvoyltetrahydropterin/6-carboxytetrahydropterin synthase